MAIYYVWSGAGGSANGSSWANAFTTLTMAFATEVAGDTLYVAHDHAESTASCADADVVGHGRQSDQGDLRRPCRHGAAGRGRPARDGDRSRQPATVNITFRRVHAL